MFEQFIASLKKQLIESSRFADIQDYFFEHLGERSEFMQLGEPNQDDRIMQMIETIGKRLLGGHVEVTHLRLIKIEQHEFYHGTCFIGNMIGTVLYFRDIDKGLLSFSKLGDSNCQYARFSCVEIKSDNNTWVGKRPPGVN